MSFKDEYKAAFSAVRPSAEFEPEEIYMKANQKRTPMRRFAAVAVAAALLLTLSLTAYAAEVFGLIDFIMPDSYQSSSLPDDAASNASDRQLISISGFADSPEAKAVAEWKQYTRAYDYSQINYDEDDLPRNASYYGAYNYEMYDKLNEIADRYGLALVTEEGFAIGSRVTHTLTGEMGSYYQYGNGYFKEESDFTASDGVTVGFSIIRSVKGSMSTSGFEIWDAEGWTYWNYTASTGDSVAVGLSGDLYASDGSYLGQRGLIMADLGDCFVTTIVYDSGMDISKTAMNELAAQLDYARLATIE